MLWHSHQAYWSLSLVLPSQSLCCVLYIIVESVNIVKSKDYKTPFLFRCSSVDAKVCVVSRGIRKEAEQNTVTAQPCRCTDVPESKTQSIGTKLCVRERETGRGRGRDGDLDR